MILTMLRSPVRSAALSRPRVLLTCAAWKINRYRCIDDDRYRTMVAMTGRPMPDIPLKTVLIDTTGLACPLPFLKLRKALRGTGEGTYVEVLSTDPLAPGDFRELCEAQGHRILASTLEGKVTRTIIAVKGVPPR
jgi:TusA-related sulfurtransferase